VMILVIEGITSVYGAECYDAVPARHSRSGEVTRS